MNCQEVMDYMQRQLDGDLDEREAELLLHHTRQCPDCAAMFERLKRLSAELENLPKVAPSYSLVDAIMPKLEQLELQRQSAETEQPPERPVPAGSRRKPQERKPKWSERISFRAFGGVIAAGIVVGLFLVTYKPDGMRTADNASTDKGASGILTFSAQSSESAAANESSAANNASPQASDNLENSSTDPNSMKITFTSEAADNNDESAANMEASPASEEPEGSEQVTGSNTNKPDHQVTHSSPPANGEATDSNSEHELLDVTDQYGPGVNQNGQLKEEASDTKQAEGEEPESRDAADIYSFTAFSSEPLVSPDGAYQALVQGETVHILTTSDNTVLFETTKSGSIANVVWSEDSTTVTFEVDGAEQKIERYRIDVTKKSEVKIAD